MSCREFVDCTGWGEVRILECILRLRYYLILFAVIQIRYFVEQIENLWQILWQLQRLYFCVISKRELSMLLLLSGMDILTAFSAVIATVNNIGPGLGEVGPSGNYGGLNPFQLGVLTFAMLLGRLELLSVLVLFSAHFWRK